MPLRIVRLGTPRSPGEGLRIGTVRRPPRGVPKAEFASQDWYDVWYPNLAPSADTMKLGQQAETAAQWAAFTRHYQREMAQGLFTLFPGSRRPATAGQSRRVTPRVLKHAQGAQRRVARRGRPSRRVG